MTVRRTRKKTKTKKGTQTPVSPAEEDTGVALIEQKRRHRPGPRPRSSEICAAAARLQAVLKSETLDDRAQEAVVVEQARGLLDELVTLLDRQRPENPLRDLAVEGAHDAIELRSILAQNVSLLRRIQAARVAHKKRHKLSAVMQALEISRPKGRPEILHRPALRRYVLLYRAHLRQRLRRSVGSNNEKDQRVLEAQLQALGEVRKEFGYDTDNAALAGLQFAKRTSKTDSDKRVAARALLPTRTEVKGKAAPSK